MGGGPRSKALRVKRPDQTQEHPFSGSLRQTTGGRALRSPAQGAGHSHTQTQRNLQGWIPAPPSLRKPQTLGRDRLGQAQACAPWKL